MRPIIPIPRYAQVLNLLGSLLLLWSLLEQMQWLRLLPADWYFPHLELVIMLLGLALLVPYQIVVVTSVLRRNKQG